MGVEDAAGWLHAVVEASRDAVIGQSTDGTITAWNPAAARMFGYADAEALGQPSTLIVPAERREEIADARRRVVGGEPLEPFETVRCTKDGRRLDVSVSLSPVRDEDGRLVGVSTIVCDLTLRKRHVRSLNACYAASRVLVEAHTAQDAGADVVRALGECLGWSVTELWLADDDTTRLSRVAEWVSDASFDPFLDLARSAGGEGLPGRVFASGEPEWVASVPEESRFVRAAVARACGLASAWAIPIRTQDRILGVLLGASREREPPDEDMLSLGASLGAQLGACLERFRMQSDLARHAERLRTHTLLLESQSEASAEGLLVVCSEGDDEVLNWNRRFLDLWDLTEEDMARRSDEVLLEKAAPTTTDPEGFLEKVRWYYAHPEASGRDEIELVDGRIFERHTAPVLTPEGGVRGRGWYFSDITARKRAEQAVRQSEARLRRVLEHAPVPIMLFTDDRRVDFINRAWMESTGYTAEELPTLDAWVRHIYAGQADALEPRLERALDLKQERREATVSISTRSGGVRVWDVVTSYLGPRADGCGEFIVTAHDVTDRDQAHQRAARERAQAVRRGDQLQRLTAELAHTEQRERRRLARLLHDHLQQLLVAARFRAVDLTGKSSEETTRDQLALITDLLDEAISASRSLTAQLSPPALYEVGLWPALRWLADWMRKTHDLTVHLELDGEVNVPREGTRVTLFEAVRELLFNVVKHAQVQEAWVDVRGTAEQVEITVEDRGVGFDSAAAAATDADSFGLLNVRERIEWVGGTFEVDARPGEGTSVTFAVPLEREPVAAPSRQRDEPPGSTPPPPSRAADSRLRLMLVDDHRVVREGVARLLSKESDLEVVAEADTGDEALELARTHRPDVVVMDVNLPGTSGVEATRRLVAELPGVRVVGLSLHAEPEIASAMRQAGAQAFVNKAGPVDGLMRAIRGARA